MSIPRNPLPAKLIASVITSEMPLLRSAFEELAHLFGPIDFISEKMPFALTTYYEKEMGSPLARRVIAFENLIAPDELPRIKGRADAVEKGYVHEEGGRKINIDPGYVTLDRLILATNKNYAHRVYLGSGVYADLTLVYRNKAFRPLEWTYPDYGSPPMLNLMNQLRTRYHRQLKMQKRPEGSAAS
jgi:hypothetical protein